MALTVELLRVALARLPNSRLLTRGSGNLTTDHAHIFQLSLVLLTFFFLSKQDRVTFSDQSSKKQERMVRKTNIKWNGLYNTLIKEGSLGFLT